MLAAAQPSISSSSSLPLRHYEFLPLYNESTPYMEKELVHRQEVVPGGAGVTNRGMRGGEKKKRKYLAMRPGQCSNLATTICGGRKVAWEPQKAALPQVPCIVMSLLFSFNRQPPSPPRSKTTHGTADMQSLQGSRLYDWLSAWIPQFT